MKNQLKTFLLLAALSALLVAGGSLFGQGWALVALGFALAMNLGAYFYSDRVVLALHRAREVAPSRAPRLHAIVAELARNADIPKPRVFVIHEAQPNAFATGRNPEHGVVAVTDGILDLLSERELRAVLAHEIAHIKNRDVLIATIAAGVAAAITYLAHAAQLFAFFGGTAQRDDEESPWASLLLLLLAPIAATLIQLGVSRSREFLADEEGARICGDPGALASALSKLEYGAAHFPLRTEPATASLFIVNPLLGARSWLGRLFSTHPSTAERVARLRALGARRQPRLRVGMPLVT